MLANIGTGRFSHVLLVPQPSDSPNDPLNWPLWKKDLILFIVGMSAAIVGAYGPMLGPGFVPYCCGAGNYCRRAVRGDCLANLDARPLRLLHEPSCKDLWQAASICLRLSSVVHSIHLVWVMSSS